MGWLADGDAFCDACGKVKHCPISDKEDFLIGSGWHYAKGITIGGNSYEMVSCPQCNKDEHKRVKKIADFDDQLDLFEGVYESGKNSTGTGKSTRSRKFAGD